MDTRHDVSLFPDAFDIRLDAGRTLRLPIEAGTVLVARAGRLRVAESSRWLGERMVAVAQDLAEGQAHVVDGAGWVDISAMDADGGWLRRVDPESAPNPLRTLLRLVARAWSGRVVLLR